MNNINFQISATFEQQFQARYLKTFADASACSADFVELFFCKQNMLIWRFLVDGSRQIGYVSYFLAPMLNDDGTKQ